MLQITNRFHNIQKSNVGIFLLKIGIAFLLGYIIYRQLHGKTNLTDVWTTLKNAGSIQGILSLVVAVLLVGANWGLEALKWQRVLKPLERISFSGSIKSILCGVTVSMLTPNRTGEYVGRILTLQQEDSFKAIPLALTCSFSQLLVNLTLGFTAFFLFCFYYSGLTFLLSMAFIGLAVSLISTALFFYFKIHALPQFLRGRFFKKVSDFVAPLKLTDHKTLLILLFWSLVRYMVYTMQYIFLLHAFGISFSWAEACILICSIYFVQTFIPSIAMAELGVRGNLALYFIGFTAGTSAAILSATFCLWLINLLIPSLAGLVFITQSGNFEKLFRTSQTKELATVKVVTKN
ncbi:MAG: flippase-like domain-containing protein [Sphingobacteriales bacterium]|nr:MAG: flippase-like domain-containing protein [Sphingobacteriales bacterium]